MKRLIAKARARYYADAAAKARKTPGWGGLADRMDGASKRARTELAGIENAEHARRDRPGAQPQGTSRERKPRVIRRGDPGDADPDLADEPPLPRPRRGGRRTRAP